MRSAARFQYSYDHEGDWLGSGKDLPVQEASMKKLINDEMSRRPGSRRNGPSVVARLMGMDAPSLESKPALCPVKKREEPTRAHTSYYEKNLRSPIIHSYSNSNFLEHEFNPVYDHTNLKPTRREHPQEEELQKFKKDFEAWQAARFKEPSRYAEIENASIRATKEEYIEPKSHWVKVKSAERNHLCSYGEKSEICAVGRTEFSSLPCRNKYRENEMVPTTIVVLKPGPDRIWSSEDSWSSFSGSSEDKGSIEDFLEEVKERLKHELQGKILQKGPAMRENRILGTVSERSQDPKRIAKEISNQIRGRVTRESELGNGLVRSESMRSQRSDIQLNEIGSPEIIHRDMRRFLAERLNNVQKRESVINIPIGASNNFSRSCLLDEKRVLQKHEEIVENEEEIHTRQDESLSPKNLVRSLSAPVTGTSFGKLLLEDRHVITGAHIRRKHEHSIENLSSITKKGKKEKEGFSLREKVYNFRSTFTLRGRLFGKKMPSMADLRTCEPSFMKDIMNGPTVISNPGERYENSTEVPPSPASVCSSSAPEEFWRASNDLSPVSSPGTTSRENVDEIHVSREIAPASNELQTRLTQSNYGRPVEGGGREHDIDESKLPDLEDGPAAYVRALLVASGLYDGLSNTYMSRLEPLAKPIATPVYEEVEESYEQQDREAAGRGVEKDDGEKGIEIDHKLLYDLLNEALSNVLGPPMLSSTFWEKISVPCDLLLHPRGQRLMDSVWGFICPLAYPPGDVLTHYPHDSMVARDLGSALWFQLLGEQVDAVGSAIEGSILRDLIGEILRDMSQGDRHSTSSLVIDKMMF